MVTLGNEAECEDTRIAYWTGCDADTPATSTSPNEAAWLRVAQ